MTPGTPAAPPRAYNSRVRKAVLLLVVPAVLAIGAQPASAKGTSGCIAPGLVPSLVKPLEPALPADDFAALVRLLKPTDVDDRVGPRDLSDAAKPVLDKLSLCDS